MLKQFSQHFLIQFHQNMYDIGEDSDLYDIHFF